MPEKITAAINRGGSWTLIFSFHARVDANRRFKSITGKKFMFVKKPNYVTCLLIVMLTLLVPIEDANAQPPDWYATASFGQASISENVFDDANTSAFSLGRRLDDNIAFEVGYTDLGQFDRDIYDDTYIEITGYEASWYGSTSIGRSIDLFARAGLFLWDLKATALGTNGGKTDGLSVLAGVGASFPFGDNFGARLQWTDYLDIKSKDVDALTLGIYFRF